VDDLRSTRARQPDVAIVQAAFKITAAFVVIHEGDECAEDTAIERCF
jgi:hypothetical protein